MNKSKVAISQIILLIQGVLGVISVFFGACGFAISVGKFDGASIVMVIFFVGIGGALIYCSIKKAALLRSLQIYVHKLAIDPTGSIANLALAARTSEDVVRKNLNILICKDFLIDAYIDDIQNCVVIKNLNNNAKVVQSDLEQDASRTNDYIVVKCKSCGGTNKVIKGQVCECEFCGAQIKGED